MSILAKIKGMENSSGNSWKYQNPGGCIAGEAVSDLRIVDTKFGKSTVIDIRSEEDGQIYTVWCTTVIESELTKQRVENGDQVGIKYLGTKKNYKDFVVHVEKKECDPVEDSPLNGEENRGPDFEREDNLGVQG